MSESLAVILFEVSVCVSPQKVPGEKVSALRGCAGTHRQDSGKIEPEFRLFGRTCFESDPTFERCSHCKPLFEGIL